MFPGILAAVVWHMDDMPDIFAMSADTSGGEPLSFLSQASAFPDTFCILSGWSPCFAAFGVREGMLYAGFRNVDLSFRTQFHRLMANHVLGAGFSVLREKHIRAGLRAGYAVSAIRGFKAKHAGSCSGNVLIRTGEQWQISLQAEHVLTFGNDSTRFFEPCTRASAVFVPSRRLRISGGLFKRRDLAWRPYLQLAYYPREVIGFSAGWECLTGDMQLIVRLKIKRWYVYECLRVHPRLGFSQSIFLSYAY